MDKMIPLFNPSTSHVSSVMDTKNMKSDIDALAYALSKNSAYVSGDPNLAKILQAKYPNLGIKEVKIPETFLRCLMHVAKSTKAKDHFFNISKSMISIADTGKDELEPIFRKGTKFNFNRLGNQYIAYHDALMRKGFFPDPKQYESCNTINATGFFRTVLNNLPGTSEIEDTIIDYVQKNPIYAYLPCFNDGILQMSDITYCRWKVNSVDIETRTISISIYLYHKEPSGYTPFAMFSAVLEFPESLTNKAGFMVTNAEYPTLYEILHAIPPKQMKWEVTDRKAWGLFIKFGKMVDEVSSDRDCISDVIQENLSVIMWCFAYINSVLNANKKHRKFWKRKPGEIKVEKSFNPEKQKEKKLHIISNLVSIESDDSPKEMTKRTAVKYHLASWTVKGHTRNCSSGKITWVRPHTKKRKGMEKEAETTAPRTQKVILNYSLGDKI